jgi:hypothetical protein
VAQRPGKLCRRERKLQVDDENRKKGTRKKRRKKRKKEK